MSNPVSVPHFTPPPRPAPTRLLLLCLCGLLACAAGENAPERLDELNAAAEGCRVRIDALLLERPPATGPDGIDSACEPVWKLRATLPSTFEAPPEYRLLLQPYLDLQVLYGAAESPDRARIERTLRRAVLIADDTPSDVMARSNAYAALARFYLEDRPDEHERLFRKAIGLSEKSGDPSVLAGYYKELADVCKSQGKLAEAEKLAKQGIAVLKAWRVRIRKGEQDESARAREPEPPASETQRSIALSKAERQLADARKQLAEIAVCQRYAATLAPEKAALCCREGEIRRALGTGECALPEGKP